MDFLRNLLENAKYMKENNGYMGSPGVIDITSARKINPYVADKAERGELTGDELFQILTKGNVDAWAEPAVKGIVAPATQGQLMENIGMQTVNGYQIPGNPSPALSTWYESPQQRHSSYPDYYTKTMGNEWTPAPFAEGAPKDIMDFYANYSYDSRGKGSFEKPIDPGYVQALWNEINQQAPDASTNNKQAFLETILSMTHGESHGGRDAGSIPGRRTNVFNMGYSADPGSTLKYDPESIEEMSDFEVERALNRFRIMQNKGMTDSMIKSYAPYAPTEHYRALMNTWHGLSGVRTPWE